MKLTEQQRDFILYTFFQDDNHLGWRHIAIKLLENGECIVAGHSCIWRGGIGNFISTTDAIDAVGCIKYIFSLEGFMKSEWFKEQYNAKMQQLIQEANEAKSRLEEHKNLAKLK